VPGNQSKLLPQRKMTELAKTDDLDFFVRFLHLGILTCGLLAYLTSGWAGDYEHAKHLGVSMHKWLGMGLALFLALRLFYGLVGPDNVRFKQWVPYNKAGLILVWEDIVTLLKFRLPHRQSHQGLAGLVQSFGLLTFSWMAFTGSFMFFYLQPGHKTGGVLHSIKELHEIGEGVIPIFLALHVGAVLLHALTGRHLWRKMFFLKDK
jgi:cytochrome b